MFEEFTHTMIKEFEKIDIGLTSYFLSIEVNQTNEDIFIPQEAYVKEVLKRFNMEDCKQVDTPMECNIKLSKYDDGIVADSTHFKILVGSIRYLTCTKLNILYEVGIMSQYMEEN